MGLLTQKNKRSIVRFTIKEDLLLKQIQKKYKKKITPRLATELLNKAEISPKVRTISSVRYRLGILKRVRSIEKLHKR